MAAAFDAAEEAFGLPAVLVNNAAANFPSPAEDLSPNAWRTVVDITLNGTFLCAREFGRRHLAAGTPGSIVNIGASYAWTGGPGFAHSAAAKAGVKNLTESLAVEWGPYGIQVNGLVPGLFPHEDMTADITGNLDRTSDKDACQPALRVGHRQELGWAATFLASPYARFVSGHTLVVDGANWQRRTLTNPPVVPVREQLGRDGVHPVTTADAAIVRTIERYQSTFSADDRDGWLALFTDDAVLEDPVGSSAHEGREAIAAFWDTVHARTERGRCA